VDIHTHTHVLQMEAGKALDIVRSEVDILQLVADVHCIIAAMMGSSRDVSACDGGLQQLHHRRHDGQQQRCECV